MLNVILNNLQAFDGFPGTIICGGTYEKCHGQAETVLRDLMRLKLDDAWDFRMAHSLGHYWAEAIPIGNNKCDNQNDPMLKLDPWVFATEILKEPYPNTVPFYPGN